MISFKDYLKKNKVKFPAVRTAITGVVGFGISHNDNFQAIGDVTGGEGGSVGGGEDEEVSLLTRLMTHDQAEEEELEFAPVAKMPGDMPEDDVGDDATVGKLELPTDDEGVNEDDPDKQGLIRKIPGAHLVYKREGEEGTFEELWMYEIKKGLRDEYDIRDDIIAGTDIVKTQTQSQDGTQSYSMWTAGNMQLLKIIGLPN